MSMESAKLFLDQKITDLTAELDQAKALRAALENKQLAGPLFGLIGSRNGAIQPKKTAASSGEDSNRLKLVRYFLDRENAWSTTTEMIEETGVDRGVINNIIYVGNPDDFESKDHPSLKRRKMWRLAPSYYAKESAS